MTRRYATTALLPLFKYVIRRSSYRYGKGGVSLSSSSSSSRQLSEDDGEEAVTSLSDTDTPHPEISEREGPHERERRPHQEARTSDGSKARISEFAGLVRARALSPSVCLSVSLSLEDGGADLRVGRSINPLLRLY